ncbi:hypothetical protein [Nocardia nepalensis]|uniref:hypothetical protein n=1 Tax=Nocardia nepalensis TaxID=3375448 RepID=UPI003B66F694
MAAATMIPLAAGLLVGQSAAADSVLPEVPGIGSIATGSASFDVIGTGSAAADFLRDGTASGSSGGVLDLEPRSAGTGGGLLGGVDSFAAGEQVPHADATVGAGEALGLDPGSIQSACTGSAVIGSAAILLGSATGSGVLGPGLVGTGSVGSSGSGLGSVIVGSAATGSALLTCLLLLPAPTPPQPGIPLQLGPPIPGPPAPPVVPSEFITAAPPAIAPEIPILATPHQPLNEAVESTPDPIAWNLLELVAVMVVTVLTVVRRITGGRHARRAE